MTITGVLMSLLAQVAFWCPTIVLWLLILDLGPSSATHVHVKIPHWIRMGVPNGPIRDGAVCMAVDHRFTISVDLRLLHHVLDTTRAAWAVSVGCPGGFTGFFLGFRGLVLTICLRFGDNI